MKEIPSSIGLMLTVTECLVIFNQIQEVHGRHYTREVNGWSFDKVDILSRRIEIYDLAFDEYISGNILYAEANRLRSHHISFGYSLSVIGQNPAGYIEGNASNARFNQITGFIQLTSHNVLIADSKNRILRLVNRVNQSTSLFAGRPGSAVARNGTFQTCQFVEPYRIKRLDNQTLLVSDPGAKTVAVLNFAIAEGKVTHLSLGSNLVLGLAVDVLNDILYIGSGSGMLAMSLNTCTAREIVKGSGNVLKPDGPIALSYIYVIENVFLLDEDTFLITDSFGLRVVDLNGNVSSLCLQVRERDQQNGGVVGSCKFYEPVSLMWYNSTVILVGGKDLLAAIEVSWPRRTTGATVHTPVKMTHSFLADGCMTTTTSTITTTSSIHQTITPTTTNSITTSIEMKQNKTKGTSTSRTNRQVSEKGKGNSVLILVTIALSCLTMVNCLVVWNKSHSVRTHYRELKHKIHRRHQSILGQRPPKQTSLQQVTTLRSHRDTRIHPSMTDFHKTASRKL